MIDQVEILPETAGKKSPSNLLRRFRQGRRMRFAALLALILALSPGANAAKSRVFTLDDIQGYWWQSCTDPAVQFAIQGDKYTGDFPGEFRVRVEHNAIVIDKGAGPAAFYRIVSASPRQIVLRPIDGRTSDWVLRACPHGKSP